MGNISFETIDDLENTFFEEAFKIDGMPYIDDKEALRRRVAELLEMHDESMELTQRDKVLFAIMKRVLTKITAIYVGILGTQMEASGEAVDLSGVSLYAELARRQVNGVFVNPQEYKKVHFQEAVGPAAIIKKLLGVAEVGMSRFDLTFFPVVDTKGVHHFALSQDGDEIFGQYHKLSGRNHSLNIRDVLMFLRFEEGVKVYPYMFNEGGRVGDPNMIAEITPEGCVVPSARYSTHALLKSATSSHMPSRV